MTLGGERLFSTHTKTPAPLPEVIACTTTGGRTQTELVSPFRNWVEGGSGRPQFRNTCGGWQRVLKPDHEPCFKASRPSYSWDHMRRVEYRVQPGAQGRGLMTWALDDMHRGAEWIQGTGSMEPWASRGVKLFKLNNLRGSGWIPLIKIKGWKSLHLNPTSCWFKILMFRNDAHRLRGS